ncbi:MAG: DNA repair protein RecO [Eubacteriaceae bacterium]|jgi:DNA repair protein RecO (recombination protein O)|nr:DNA repair protein RecO [Eubacteriaceae bacterium]
MALVKTKGLVIRERPYREQGKMLTIFTEKEGKVNAIAHNAKGVRSQLAESTQLFAYSNFNYYKGKNFANINNADSIHSFYKLRDDLKKMTLGSYILELVDLLYEWYQGDAQTLRLIIHALYYLDECQKGNLLGILVSLQLKLSILNGIHPKFDGCSNCGSEENIFYFSHEAGGVFCNNCRDQKGYSRKISTEARRLLHRFLREPLNMAKAHEPVDETIMQEAFILMNAYLSDYLNKTIRSYQMYLELFKENTDANL